MRLKESKTVFNGEALSWRDGEKGQGLVSGFKNQKEAFDFSALLSTSPPLR
jgi:hypothetical protein